MRKKLNYIVLATVAALIVSATALSASGDQGRRLTGPFCINAKTGAVRSVALLHTGHCKPGELRRLGVAGLAGPSPPTP